jgi:hypothetical protein
MADRKFLDFLDMFDGGGAGQMGDKFEGGGLYSMIGNLVGSPYGSQDEERKKARMAAYGSDNIGGPLMATPPPVGTVGGPPMATPPPVGTVGGGAPQYSGRGTVGMPSRDYTTSGMTPTTAYQPPMQYGGRGSAGMPMPSQNYTTSGMTPTTAYVDPRQRFAQDLVDMYGPDMADMVMNSGIVEDTYRGYVDRGYRF